MSCHALYGVLLHVMEQVSHYMLHSECCAAYCMVGVMSHDPSNMLHIKCIVTYCLVICHIVGVMFYLWYSILLE